VPKRISSSTITQSFSGGNVNLPATVDSIDANGCRFFTTCTNSTSNFDGSCTADAGI
jgi:hypothetical protein